MSGRWVAVTGVLALAVLPLAGCGHQGHPRQKASVSQTVKQCQAQWHDVADSVVGLDQDPDPSSLASRWTSVIATVDYYQTSNSTLDCQVRVASELQAITALRNFSERLRPYDMTYQLNDVMASVELYLHDPVPAPAKGANGKLIKAPTHRAVAGAIATLTNEAADANVELQPAWEHLASVSLDDDAAVTAAIGDLDSLAQAGAHWTRCQRALQVIVAAQRAQEGLLGRPEEQPTGTPTS